MASLIEGQTLIIQAAFRTAAGALEAQDTVTLNVQSPSGTSSPTASSVSTGVYEATITAVAGKTSYTCIGVKGSVTKVGQGSFQVAAKLVS